MFNYLITIFIICLVGFCAGLVSFYKGVDAGIESAERYYKVGSYANKNRK